MGTPCASERDYFMLRAPVYPDFIAWREADVLIAGFLLHDGLMAASEPTPADHIHAVPKPPLPPGTKNRPPICPRVADSLFTSAAQRLKIQH